MINEIIPPPPIPDFPEAHYYRCPSIIFNSVTDGIYGHGIANITTFRKLAKIDFIVYITVNASLASSSNFSYGLNRDYFTAIGAPVIIPINSGTLQYFRNGSLVPSLMGYAGTFEARNQFWTPARIYDSSGLLGSWPETQFQGGDILSGTCYGTVVE